MILQGPSNKQRDKETTNTLYAQTLHLPFVYIFVIFLSVTHYPRRKIFSNCFFHFYISLNKSFLFLSCLTTGDFCLKKYCRIKQALYHYIADIFLFETSLQHFAAGNFHTTFPCKIEITTDQHLHAEDNCIIINLRNSNLRTAFAQIVFTIR